MKNGLREDANAFACSSRLEQRVSRTGLHSLPVELRSLIFNLVWSDSDMESRLRGASVLSLMSLTAVNHSIRHEMPSVWRRYASGLQETVRVVSWKDPIPSPYSYLNEQRKLELASILVYRISTLALRIAENIDRSYNELL